MAAVENPPTTSHHTSITHRIAAHTHTHPSSSTPSNGPFLRFSNWISTKRHKSYAAIGPQGPWPLFAPPSRSAAKPTAQSLPYNGRREGVHTPYHYVQLTADGSTGALRRHQTLRRACQPALVTTTITLPNYLFTLEPCIEASRPTLFKLDSTS